jgi:hypothetical protein
MFGSTVTCMVPKGYWSIVVVVFCKGGYIRLSLFHNQTQVNGSTFRLDKDPTDRLPMCALVAVKEPTTPEFAINALLFTPPAIPVFNSLIRFVLLAASVDQFARRVTMLSCDAEKLITICPRISNPNAIVSFYFPDA